MKSTIFLKKVNNTEVGKAGTHESYILVPTEVDVIDIFGEPDRIIHFMKRNNPTLEYEIRLTIGREKRICGFGPFYAANDASAGDIVYLEKRELGETVEYYVDIKKATNSIVLQKSRLGVKLLSENANRYIDQGIQLIDGSTLKYSFITSQLERRDAPSPTNFYSLTIDGQSIEDQYRTKDLIEIKLLNHGAYIVPKSSSIWKKMIIEVDE